MKNYFHLLLILGVTLCAQTFAGNKHRTCKLERGEVLNIGCTTKCKYFYKKALYRIAGKDGFRVNIINMYKEQISENFTDIDGIVIPGGADINPNLYKNKVEPELKAQIEKLDYLMNYSAEGDIRDPFESNLLKNYFAQPQNMSLPVLGICRGMQMLAVSQGVPLIVDIKAEVGIKNRRYLFDRVILNNEDTLIKSILGFTRFWGYKYHHQGIRIPYFDKFKEQRWPHLSITAYSNNGLVAESLEFKNRPILGTQFHPEIDFWTERRRTFGWFLNEACKNKNLKKAKALRSTTLIVK